MLPPARAMAWVWWRCLVDAMTVKLYRAALAVALWL